MTTTTKKKTKRDERIEANRAKYLAIVERFDERIAAQDPDDPLTHDRMWNPKHPEYVENVSVREEAVVEFETSATAVVRDRDGFASPVASPKQRSYLTSLLDQTRLRDHPSILELIDAVKNGTPISSSDASAAIDLMKLEPRPNKYGGPCGICDGYVDAGVGGIHRISGRWQVRHLTADECEAARAERAAKPVDETPEPDAGLDLRSVPSGRYADPEGDGRLKLRIDNVDKGKWAGFVFVKDAAEYGMGRRYGRQAPGQSYRGDVEDVLARIVADPAAAMARFGQLTGTCGACGRTLEDEKSIELGIGPVCRTKGAFA